MGMHMELQRLSAGTVSARIVSLCLCSMPGARFVMSVRMRKNLILIRIRSYVMGSSAGGHLAALISTYYEPIPFEHMDAIDEQSAKPNGQILCYPVIKLLGKEITHLDSGKNLLGERQAELGEKLKGKAVCFFSARNSCCAKTGYHAVRAS